MKRLKRITSLVLLVAITLSLGATAYAAPNDTQEKYIEIEVPIVISPQTRALSPLVGGAGVMNAFFSPGQTAALSAPVIFDFEDYSLPPNARITNVTVSSSRTYVPGVTYYIAVGRATSWGDDWCPDMLWSSTVSTSWFNGEHPFGIWAIELYATRVITYPDYGAAATLSYATLKIYFV